MDISTFQKLLTPTGQEAIASAESLQPTEASFLQHFTALEKHYPKEIARSALEIAILRAESAEKLIHGDRMYLTRNAMEQASSTSVSGYRSKRFTGFDTLFDMGCSVGADTYHMAHHAPTVGVDLDLLRLFMAGANIQVLQPPQPTTFLQADLTDPLPFKLHGARAGLFFDPARREDGRRIYSVRAYHPPLDIIDAWLPHFQGIGVKISPGVQLSELLPYECEVEFISWSGELKEAVLWFGPLKTTSRRATLLPGEHSMAGEPLQGISRLQDPGRFLYEPDAAILRAGLVRNLGEQISAGQLDPDIAYLTSDTLVETPFARAWRVESWMPFNLKKLRAFLRSEDVGSLTVKKRGSPIQPEDLIRSLKLAGTIEKTLVVTKMRGEPVVIICSPEVFRPSV